MTGPTGRTGVGEAKLPRAAQVALRQKTQLDIPQHTCTTKPRLNTPQYNTRPDIPQQTSAAYTPQHTHTTRPDIPQHTYTKRPDTPQHTSDVKTYRPKFLAVGPNEHDHEAGCGCASATHTRPTHTHVPVGSTSTHPQPKGTIHTHPIHIRAPGGKANAHPYPQGLTSHTSTHAKQPAQPAPQTHPPTKHTTHQPRPVGQLLYSQQMIQTNSARPRVIRSRQEGVRFPTVRRLTTKMQTHTTQSTHSFTPFKRRRLSTYGTVVRRGRTEKSCVGASNHTHPHPKKVIRAPTTPITTQEEGHLIPYTTDDSNTRNHNLISATSGPPSFTPSPHLTYLSEKWNAPTTDIGNARSHNLTTTSSPPALASPPQPKKSRS